MGLSVEFLEKNNYPWIRLGIHLEHCLDLGVVALHLIFLADGTPSVKDTILFTGGYFFFYVNLVNVNYLATGGWVYWFMTDAYNAGGIFCLFLVEATLTGFAIGLALVGHYFLTANMKAQAHESRARKRVVG